MEKEIKKYLAAVRRRLNLPGRIKDRCLSDLETSIRARLEQGETWDQVRTSLGQPKEAAAELNEQMKDYVYHKSPWRFLFLALAIGAGFKFISQAVSSLTVTLLLAGGLRASESASVGIIGGADGPTAIFVTAPAWIHTCLWGLLVIVGILGFLRLRRCKAK